MNKEHNKYEATLCRLLPELRVGISFSCCKVSTYLRYESMVYVLFRIVFLVSLSTQVYNRTIMNELNCGQEEQYAGPEKKKSTSKIVKRTFVVAALALAVCCIFRSLFICFA